MRLVDDPGLHAAGALSYQLNIVATVDVSRMVASGSADGCVFLVDNGEESTGKGGAHHTTVCEPGQVLNWLVYSMDSQPRPDGTYPPMARITAITFLEGDTDRARVAKVVDELKVYGAPDRMRSPYTPVYYYWAGMLPTALAPGLYRYRFLLEVPDPVTHRSRYFDTAAAALEVRA